MICIKKAPSGILSRKIKENRRVQVCVIVYLYLTNAAVPWFLPNTPVTQAIMSKKHADSVVMRNIQMTRDLWKNLEFKMVTVLLLVIVPLVFAVYYIVSDQYYTLTINKLKSDAVNIHKFAESAIDERSFYDINEVDDQDSAIYKAVHAQLNEIRRIANIRYLYTAKQDKYGNLIYLIDGLDKSDSLFRNAGDPVRDEIIPKLEQCLDDGIVLENKIMDTERGAVYVAHFPFHDSEGKVIGAIGMEFDCEYLLHGINRTRLITIFITVFLGCGFIAMSVLIINRIVRNSKLIFMKIEKSLYEANERTMLMLDTSPICAQIWDRNLNTIDCNEAGVRLYEFKDKAEYTERFLNECSPKFQPDGQHSDEKAVKFVHMAFEEGYCRFDWTHRMPDTNTLFPAEVTLVRAKYRDEDVVIGYTRDLREYEEMMQGIKYRDSMLMAANQMAINMLNSDVNFFEKVLHESMSIIAEAVKVDCVYLWRNQVISDELFCFQIFEWSAEKTMFADGKPYRYNEVVPGWEEILSSGKNINDLVRNMSPKEQDHLTPSGILSILVVPIFINDVFWGFVGFDDCHEERIFTKEEESILHSASLIIANSFIRNEMIQNICNTSEQLIQRDNLMQAVNRSATFLLTTEEDEDIEAPILASMKLVGSSLNADRVYIWRNEMIEGEQHFVCLYGWYNEIGMQKRSAAKGQMFAYKDRPRWKEKFFRGECINGPVSKLPQDEQKFADFEISSVVIIPLFLDDEFWGFFSLDDCVQERTFKEEEVAILRSVSLMMANAINRHALVEKRTRELALQTTTLASLFDSIPDFIFTKDSDLRFMHCNRAFLEHFGLSIEDVVGKDNISGLGLSAETSELLSTNDRRVMREDRIIKLEEQMLRADGMTLVYETTKLPLKINDKVVGMMGISHDITERKKAAENALDASRSKSAFLANMSHEIRTPMNAIVGFTEILMQNEELPEDVEEGLNRIYSSCNLLVGIINDILDFSKIEAGKLDIVPVEYKLANLINDSIHLNIVRIESKPIKFELEISAAAPSKLIGDKLRIKQILNNLLSNAFKYTDAGKVTLSVEFERARKSPNDVTLVLRVRDTGFGMTKDQLSTIFEEYSRFDKVKNSNIEGTGLGLAITYHLINLMGGQIKVESEPRVGTLFTVRLPQKMADDEILGEEMVENLRKFRMNYVTNKRKGNRIERDLMPYGSVLVVDDVPTNIYVAVGLMKHYRLQIDTAISGIEAIEKIKDGKVYDVIFMDHMMPEMDGAMAVKQIREMGYENPIVALTANAVAGMSDFFLQNGFDEFISKPIDINHLNSVLNKLIRDKYPPQIVEVARLGLLTSAAENGSAAQLSIKPAAIFQNRSIAGIDIVKGLERYDGDEETYLKVLRSYSASLRSMLDPIETFCEETLGDYERAAHSVKGMSRGIFAEELGSSAEELEKAASVGNINFVNEHNGAFFKTVQKLVSDIDDLISTIDAENPKPQKDKPDADLLIKLSCACKAFDIYEVDAAMDIIEKYKYTSDGGLADWLRENIDKMKFAQIVERLSDIKVN